MIANNPPTILQRSPCSFETTLPGALAAWLMANGAYRLTNEGMVIAVFRLGLVLAEGKNAMVAVLLLRDLCDAEGGER
ncbi:MAG: hypothetical protein ACR2JW_17520 [Thermomicrobiales bacterium]